MTSGAISGFNPRAREGRDSQAAGQDRRNDCFNPRAREGRDFHHRRWQRRVAVSIHAPARGATKILWIDTERHQFQSTRPRGARPPVIVKALSVVVFQSTRPRGARLYRVLSNHDVTLFQSTRPRGARHRNAILLGDLLRSFNPRAREGRDQIFFFLAQDIARFNPRAREGRDESRQALLQICLVSIHAPARGATKRLMLRLTGDSPFQSTRPRGARQETGVPKAELFQRFNPRAREGRDVIRSPINVLALSFNPRAREGRDSTALFDSSLAAMVSIHAPARGATTLACLLL